MPKEQGTIDYVRHECGHLVVAKSLGFETGSIKLSSREAGAIITLLPSIGSVDDLKRYIEKRVQVLFAGAIAQSLTGRKPDSATANHFLKTTANQDYAKARELVRIHVGAERVGATEGDFGEKLEQTVQRLYEKAGKTVQKHATAILDLSLAFMRAWAAIGSPPDFEFSAEEINQLPAITALNQEIEGGKD